MTLKVSRFSDNDVIVEQKKTVYDGFFSLDVVRLRHRLFDGGWSETIERELFIKATAVCAMVYDPERDLIGLVEQFRLGTVKSPCGPWSLEGVAGMVEPGETPENVIKRELMEEANLVANKLIPITAFYPTPGSCNEFTHLYCALCNLENKGGVYGLPQEGEDILFSVHSAQEVFDAMLGSRMNNAATLVGLMWLQLNKANLQGA